MNMTNSGLALALALALGGLLGGGAASAVEQTNAPTAATNSAPRPAPRRASPYMLQMERMTFGLNLAEEQKTKVSDLLSTNATKTREMHATPGLTPQQRQEKAAQIREDFEKGMKGILTVEQFETWKKRQRPPMPPRPTPSPPEKKAEEPKAS